MCLASNILSQSCVEVLTIAVICILFVHVPALDPQFSIVSHSLTYSSRLASVLIVNIVQMQQVEIFGILASIQQL